MEDLIFIPGNVPSSKNSKIATSRGVFHSKTVQKYLRSHGIQHFSSSKKFVTPYKTIPLTFPVHKLRRMFDDLEKPITIGFHFVRGTKHKFDFTNLVQILLDLFVAFDIIDDDNMDNVIPQCLWIDSKHYSYDKENPGVLVRPMG